MQCPRCAQINQPEARYCRRCGYTLHEAPPGAASAAEQTVIQGQPAAAASPRPPAPRSTEMDRYKSRVADIQDDATVMMLDDAPSASSAADHDEHSQAKQATHFSIIVATISVVLLFVAAIFFLWDRQSNHAAPEVALSMPQTPVAKPLAAVSAPGTAASLPSNEAVGLIQSAPAVAASAPAIAASATEPAAPAASASATPAPEPAPVALSAPSEAASAPAKARLFKDSELPPLVADMKRHKRPADCASAVKILVSDYHVLARQAVKVAKQAYPDLCAAPAAAASASPTPAAEPAPRAPVAEPPAPAPAPKPRMTLDEVFDDRANAECSKGAFGHICRETIRLKLCSGRLSDNPPAGQTICKQ